MAQFQWPNSHDKLDRIAADAKITWPAPAEGKKKITWEEKVAILEAAGVKSPFEAAGAPPKGDDDAPAKPKAQSNGPRDATYDELYDYAISKGNSTKAATIFAENNTDNGGYVVDESGELKFDKSRQGQ